MLQVKGNQIVDGLGKAVRLRGTCVGGWMNMENFINGYPGDEHGIRAAMADVLGASKGQFFFDRWLDTFFAEEDVALIQQSGATVVRLPLNYRHFENDATPFRYLEAGFARLDRVVDWCAKHRLYVILDLHAVQGWQSTDWHCDNSSRHTHFWQHPHFQDRFVALWEEFARHYKGQEIIAGYNVMNEPVTNAPAGRFLADQMYRSDWETINRVYRRVVKAIRAIDPDHIIFLEGDLFSQRFEHLDAPFADNLVYSSHNYTGPTYGFAASPSEEQRRQNRERQRELFLAHEGTRFTQRYQVPLWVGEFGGMGDSALDDQLQAFEEFGAHWTIWTYKGIGMAGFVGVDPNSEYMQVLDPMHKAKEALGVETFWFPGMPETTAGGMMRELAHLVEQEIGDPDIDPAANLRYLRQAALDGYVAKLMQPSYAKRFKGMSESDLDRVLRSFALQNCRVRQEIMDVLGKHYRRPA